MEIIGPDFRALMITKHQSYYIHTVLLGVVFFFATVSRLSGNSSSAHITTDRYQQI